MENKNNIWSRLNQYRGNSDISTFNKVLDEAWGNMGARLLLTYAESYKRDPRALISSFIKFDSIKCGALCALQNARRQGLWDELKGQKDFSEYVSKLELAERWKPVLNKFLVIIWGCLKD